MRPLLGLAAVSVLALSVLALRPGLVAGWRAERLARGVPGLEAAVGGGVAARPAAPVAVTDEVLPYPVAGADTGEILRSMAAAAPREGGETFFGLTTTSLSFRFGTRTAGGACRLDDVHVALAVQVVLPEWTAPPGTVSDLRRDWARFRTNLARHEDEHRTLAEAGAERLRNALDGLAAPTCAGARAEAARTANRISIETGAAHRRYDDETGHGRTQGAVWP